MARPNQAAKSKRDRERARQDRQQEKREKRTQRGEDKKERDRLQSSGIDPDIADIVPGPQPLPVD